MQFKEKDLLRQAQGLFCITELVASSGCSYPRSEPVKYCEFQAAYKDHLAVLRTEKRKVPRQEGAT